MKTNNKCKISFLLIFCFAILLAVFLLPNTSFAATGEGYKYLSDEDINPTSVRVGWDTFRKDHVNGNGKISVKVEGAYYSFDRGLWAHASSEIVYDLRAYDYDYFTAYVGLNQTAASSSNGVIFKIYTSLDGRNWNIKYNEGSVVCRPGDNATHVKIDIRTEKYLKLEANDNRGNGSDHSVYADAKLIKEGYKEPGEELVPSITELDTQIKGFVSSNANLETNKQYELALLKRELISRTGNYALKRFIGTSKENEATFRWLISDVDNIRLYVLGGTPEGGSYFNSLTQLSRLYNEYSSDFTNNTRIENDWCPANMTRGDLYKKMAITLSLTHSQNVGLWMQSGAAENKSDALRRYAIYKFMYENGKLSTGLAGNWDITKWFEALQVEEMRFVMNNLIDDEEILWLNTYIQDKLNITKNPGHLTPHSYIAYIWPNYGDGRYYAEENRDYFNELFAISKTTGSSGTELANGKIGLFDAEFTIPGGKNNKTYTIKVTRGTPQYKLYKVWMNFRNKFGTGCVCGGISKSGSNIRATHGIPATVIGQPGHAALLYYTKDTQGKGYWNLDNDVSGWTLSEKGERMLLGWGNASYSRGYSVVYFALSQEALNDYANFVKCEEQVMLAKVYAGDLTKQEQLYRKALEIQPINIDAWVGLINVYNSSENKTENDYYDLAEELAENLKYFPLPMQHLTNLIKPKLTSIENSYRFTLLQTRILTEGSNTPNNTADNYYVYQPSLTRLEANYLLGKLDKTIATFSFDGNDAGKIVLSSRFDGSGVRWDYSLDGKQTWKEKSFTGEEEHKLQLTEEEIASITAENDIYIHIVGVNYDEKNLYKIDIKESAGLPSTLYANDLENRLIAAIPAMQWKYSEEDEWTTYRDEEPDLTGDKTVIVRVGATGTYLASKTSKTYTFTQDNLPDTRQYIKVSHLSIKSVSSEATGQGRHARNAIDANPLTNWHSAWDGSDRNKFIVIALDEPKNLTALEYFPVAGGNGKIEKAQILTSMDGENWTEVVSETNWTYANTNDTSMKSVEFEPTKAKYIKIVGKKTQAASSSMSFMVAAMFNLYENKTVELVGTFSFDGENGGKIVLLDEYKTLNWKYSLNGGTTWKNGTDEALTQEEMNQIDENNKIKIKFEGNETIYTINIKKGETPNITPYVNDWENRLIGIANIDAFEWKIEGEDSWKSYSEEEAIVEGNKKLFVRAKATRNFVASDALEYQFNEDTDTNAEKYIPIEHLSIHNKSTQSIDASRPFYAEKAIDGNINTQWHTDFRYSIAGTRAFITIKLDNPRHISALEFIQKRYREDDPSFIRNAIVYVSENGTDWIEAGRKENCEQNEELKKISFDESIYGQYVKLEVEGHGIFASAAIINLYENTEVKRVASFSFDGENAKKIILEDEYKALNWEYSLNSGETWKSANGGEYLLSEEEINAINSDDKIKIRFENMEEEYTINIQKSATPTITPYVNDLENRLIGITNTDTLEWKIEGEGTWKSYQEEEPVVQGTKKLLVRAKAKGIFTASDIIEYNFTEDNQEDTRKYVPISKLSLASVSAEDKPQNGAAVNAIDGNYNTRWLNSSAGTDTGKYIVIKFDSAIYLSAMDYVPHAENGKILSGKILGSMDGENFTEIAQITNWQNNQNTKTIDFDESVKVRYVKIIGEETSYTSAKRHVGARMFNFYQDITKKQVVIPTAEVQYSTTNNTNQDVIVTLVNPSTQITVLNNNGNTTYTFTENGTFTFEFEDSEGNKGTATATVDWICKSLPEAIFEYDITDPTNKDVTVTVTFKVNGEFDNRVVILNNNGSNKHTFTENDEFTFEFRGPYGNEGVATATVDWINKDIPSAEITYDHTELTNGDVVATLNVDEGITITNNNGSNTYTFSQNGSFTFEFRNELGNTGTATATVDWIDKVAPVPTISYNIMEATNGDVVATISFDKENVTVTGGNTHTFTENGSFTFEFEDAAGNEGTAIATVNWIDKTLPVATITYSTENLTNRDVIATITFDAQGVTVEGGNTHTFTENSEYVFKYTTSTGSTGVAKAEVTWIDKQVPQPTMVYNTIEPTTGNVLAAITFDKENVTITNNGGDRKYLFTDNGTFTFEYVDEAGNGGSVNAVVNWIDRVAPTAEINYSTEDLTNGNVIATLVNPSEEITITNNKGSNTRTFTGNGTYTFEFEDLAGNKGTAVATVNNIDKNLPKATITYSTTNWTNEDVEATISFDKENVTVAGGNTHVFTGNGEYVFEYRDEAGNISMTTSKVTWIDKTAPTATISYSTESLTNGDVIATLNPSEQVTITNNNGSNAYTFTENSSFTFEFVDRAGNTGTAVATVNNIDKVAPVATITYSTEEPTTGNVVATITFDKENVTVEGGNTHTFTGNGTYTFEFEDLAGNKGTAVATVNWIEKDPDVPPVVDPDEYEVGDVNKDGKITATDILLVQRHLVAGVRQEWILTGDRFNLGDINQDGKITGTDLILIKRLQLKQAEKQ